MIRQLFFFFLALTTLLPAQDAARLRPGDVLEMQMVRPDEMLDQITIGLDGTAPFQLLNRVKIEGLTLQEASDLILKNYQEKFYKNPQIILRMKDAADATVNVMGAVATPMAINIKRGEQRDIVGAIQQAGGLTPNADQSDIVLRREGAQPQIFSYNKLTARGAKQILLMDGDEVAVGFNKNANKQVGIIGEVQNPANYPFRLDGVHTIEMLIGQAGGLTPLGVTNGLTILRGQKEFRAPNGLRTRLLHGDVVKIPKNPNVGKFVTLSGNVQKPGKLALGFKGKLSLSEAVAQAGGPDARGDVRKIDIRRNGRTTRHNLADIRAGKAQDVPLRHGDQIHIQKRRF